MRNLTPTSITQAFADYAKNAPSERTRTLLVSLAGHLHSFVRENKVTQAEWGAAIDALTRATKFTDDKRNEYILFSDLLGVSSLVDMINAATTGTQSSVLGPFLIEGAPELPNGGDLWKGQVGEPLVVLGRNAWRPAHLHMIINAPGHKPLITEFFPEDDKYLDGDAVFGVRAGLVLPFKKVADRKELPANL